jgi:ribosomal protein S18 acetylase RimI-like enzyme
MKEKRVETANALSASEFFAAYAPDPNALLSQGHPDIQTTLADASTISSHHLEACLTLIELTSAEDYRHSETKWSVAKKRKEMKLPDMKYIVLTTTEVVGFISFMITYEDGYEVAYIYEIHLQPKCQGKGMGKKLVEVVEVIGRKVGVTKAMLTVFTSNRRALDWYGHLGYREDEFSPGPRRLRNGTVKEATYKILSKPLSS